MAVCEKCKKPCECKAKKACLKAWKEKLQRQLRELESQEPDSTETSSHRVSFENDHRSKWCQCKECRLAFAASKLPPKKKSKNSKPSSTHTNWSTVKRPFPSKRCADTVDQPDVVYVSTQQANPRVARRQEIGIRCRRLSKVLDKEVEAGDDPTDRTTDREGQARSKEVTSLIVYLMTYLLILQGGARADDVKHPGL